MGLNLLPEIYQDQQLTSIDPIINFTTINPLDQLSIASFWRIVLFSHHSPYWTTHCWEIRFAFTTLFTVVHKNFIPLPSINYDSFACCKHPFHTTLQINLSQRTFLLPVSTICICSSSIFRFWRKRADRAPISGQIICAHFPFHFSSKPETYYRTTVKLYYFGSLFLQGVQTTSWSRWVI